MPERYHGGMQEEKQQKPSASVLVSALYPDGTILETVCDPVTQDTAFVSACGDAVARHGTWERDGKRFRPIRATNNLLKHGALRFAAEAAEYGDASALLEEIDQYLTRYVSLPEAARHLATGYILLTWLYDAFSELPYLRFRGEYGTGKTRALLVVGGITYKPFFASGASTVSPIFHTLDTFRGTLIFDEADFRFTDEKAELVKILNNGNARGFPVLRTRVTEKREFDPQAFVVYGPKIVGMRHAYDDRALESRFLSIDMVPGRRGEAPLNLPAEQEADALALRNKLLMFRFRTRLGTTLDPSLTDHDLEPRTNQILLPLLSVVQDETIRRSIRGFAAEREGDIRRDRSLTLEGDLLSILAAANPDRLPLRALVTRYGDAYGAGEQPLSHRYVGAILRRLGLALYKSDGVTVIAPGQRTAIEALAVRYGIAVESLGTAVETMDLGI